MFRQNIFRLAPNRIWRTYLGGRQLDGIEGRRHPSDGPFPEDWIGSTVRAMNPESIRNDEGLTRVSVDGSEVLLVDLIAADPSYFLGPQHVANFGTDPCLLVKYLDSSVRLPFQVHPTNDFARTRLKSEHGKSEAYYVLATRPEVLEPFIYLGFQRPPTRDEFRRMIVEQDIAAMERCFDRIPACPGDVFVVPGGIPHAIGPGIFLVELMEPTDFVARVEFQCAGRVIPQSARFMGYDVDFALDMISFKAQPSNVAKNCWRFEPRVAGRLSDSGAPREALLLRRQTDRFRLFRTALRGQQIWRPQGYTILLVIDGACTVVCGATMTVLKRYDRALIPFGLKEALVEAPNGVVFLECLPPETGVEAISKRSSG